MRGTGNTISKTAIIAETAILNNVVVGDLTRVCDYVNIYRATLGKYVMIGVFSEIQNDCVVGDYSRVQSHSFIPAGTVIGERCFISHGYVGINDTFSNYKVNFNSELWGKIEIGSDVVIGSSVTMFPCKIGNGAIVGANSLVTKDIGENEIWYGNPAKFIKMKDSK